jgi:hypothetical protein
MIRAAFVEPSDEDWRDWRKRANDETTLLTNARKSGTARDIDADLYKAQRERILRAFHGKCAYCEVLLEADQIKGDVEHYRPKNKVTDAKNRVVWVQPPGSERKQKHPGYYWLAYQWENLLPSCVMCNRPSKIGGMLIGKGTRFPVENDAYGWDDDTTKGEKAMLLNPWNDDPNDHLGFHEATGIVATKTERGRITVEILGLNKREKLVELRKRAYEHVMFKARDWLDLAMKGDATRSRTYLEDLKAIQAGDIDFAAVRRAAMNSTLAPARSALDQLNPSPDPR